jgi:hypothetical protein
MSFYDPWWMSIAAWYRGKIHSGSTKSVCTAVACQITSGLGLPLRSLLLGNWLSSTPVCPGEIGPVELASALRSWTFPGAPLVDKLQPQLLRFMGQKSKNVWVASDRAPELNVVVCAQTLFLGVGEPQDYQASSLLGDEFKFKKYNAKAGRRPNTA